MEPKVLWAVMAGRETEAHFTTPVEAVAWLHRRPWVRPTSWLDDGFRYVEVH